MPPAKTLVEVVLWLEELFARHGADHSFGGAFARNFYAPPRLTKDIDVLARVSQLRIPALVDDLAAEGVGRTRLEQSTGKEVVVALDLGGFLADLRTPQPLARLRCFGIPVEIFAPWHPFDHEVLRAAVPRQAEGHTVRVHRPEDLIVYKKVFDRSKDIEDIKAILVANAGRLDLDRIRTWAQQLIDEHGLAELDRLVADFYQ